MQIFSTRKLAYVFCLFIVVVLNCLLIFYFVLQSGGNREKNLLSLYFKRLKKNQKKVYNGKYL